MNRQASIVTMILAGGKGERLYPLTVHRSKPAVPFGGSFRIIDFTLMNCLMSNIRQINVLTQYHSQSLSSHIQDRWSFLNRELGEYIEIVPPKLKSPTGFYKGTADSVYRNLDILEFHRPDVVLILSGDHVYRADYGAMVRRHLDSGSDVTVLCGEAAVDEASAFGVVDHDGDFRIKEFIEKPADPRPYSRSGSCCINLGVYCFNTPFLVQRLVADAKRKSHHDFGRNIFPESVNTGRVTCCPFKEIAPAEAYWRDVGSIDGYFQCHQDLLAERPAFELLDPRWPRGSRLRDWLPVKISSRSHLEAGWSLLCGGVEIDKAKVIRSVLSPGVKVGAGAVLDHCVVFSSVNIGDKARVRNAIIDEGVQIPEGAQIGYGNDSDRFAVSPGGIVVVERGYRFDREGAPGEHWPGSRRIAGGALLVDFRGAL